ncbi:MAG: hypothetical protein D8M58_20990 [Calditrichaeota bacterium]|nr:MAG: hypothetical protein DWQ03_16705 [Calditrichota bacterium]MBL1207888.1 hypothetical protein [Calditrichota bacterium]NOG47723.1 hypothetical protein [Calditrichota bacterium]
MNFIKKVFQNGPLYVGLFFIISGISIAQEIDDFSVNKEISGDAQNHKEKNTITYTVEKNQKEIYSITNSLDYDAPVPEFIVFEDGAGVMVSSFDASLTFFDNLGEKIVKLKINKELKAIYERSIYSAIDENNLLIALSQPGLDYSLIQIYNEKGVLLNDWKIENEHVNGLQFAKSQNILAVSSYSWGSGSISKNTQFFNRTGDLLQQSGNNFSSGSFVKNGEAFSGYRKHLYFLYDLTKKSTAFEFISKNDIIITAEYKSDEIIIVTTEAPVLNNGNWYYINPTIKVFSKEGKEISSRNEKTQPFSSFSLEQKDDRIFFKTNTDMILVK